MPETEPSRAARILLVDDDADLRFVLARWLTQQGLRVLQAASTGEAVEMLGDAAYLGARLDGLLVDFHLPDATGCRVVQEFLEEFPGVPVALMTGTYDLSLELWLKARHIPLFRKPLNLDGLRAWVARLREPRLSHGATA
jgi:DNA-binding NtrC family response regulator